MGEGWGEGDKTGISTSYISLTLSPLPPREGKWDFFRGRHF